MVLKIPKFYATALSLCERPFSLLGFGDILLPGKVRLLSISSSIS